MRRIFKNCLESLVNQTLKEIEIICINDDSTDNSQNILQEYARKDRRIIIINKENEGQSVARNIGMKTAQGKYLGFVDSNDWVDLNFFEKLYNSAEKYNADIAAAGIARVHKFYKNPYINYKKEILLSDFKEKLDICNVPDRSYITNKIYKNEALKKNTCWNLSKADIMKILNSAPAYYFI